MSHVREVVQHHMEAVYAGDLDEIVAGYTDDAVLIEAQRGAHRGREAIREVFAEALGDVPVLRPETKIEEAGNVVFVSSRTRRAGQADLAGADTFAIEGGRIAVHTGFHIEAAPIERDIRAAETAGAVMPAVVERYIAAVNDEDWATIATLFTSDAEVRALGAPVARGPEEIAAHFREVLGALPSQHDEPTRVVAAGSVVVVEMVVQGRTTDDLPVEFDAVDVIELSPDATAIVRWETWYDTAAVSAMMRGS